MPFKPFLWLAGFCGFMALWRLPSAVGVWYRKHRLRRFQFEYLDAENLKRTASKHQDEIWLGWGFDWGQRHAQLAYEILKRDVSGIIPTDHGRMGAAWVHGLETKESEVFQPISHTAGHTLIVGTTGSGKTRLFDILVTQAVLRGEAVIVIDPKVTKT